MKERAPMQVGIHFANFTLPRGPEALAPTPVADVTWLGDHIVPRLAEIATP